MSKNKTISISAARLMVPFDLATALVKPIYQDLARVQPDDTPAALLAFPEATRTLFLVYEFKGLVDDGGLHYFFGSYTANMTAEVHRSLVRVGAVHHAHLLKQGCLLFPDGAPPADLATRNKVLRTIIDRTTKELATLDAQLLKAGSMENLEEHMRRYIFSNAQAFLLPG
jgi:hypothetical protein